MSNPDVYAHHHLQVIDIEERRHLDAIRTERQRTRLDELCDPVTRVVLGATGSPSELERYQRMQMMIEGNYGEPLIVLGEPDPQRIVWADGGIIDGSINGHVASHSESDNRRGSMASLWLDVPVKPFVHIRNYKVDGVTGRPGHGIEQTDSSITIANFVLMETTSSSHPEEDYSNRIDDRAVLIGRAALYSHPAFTHGLSDLLIELDERVATLSKLTDSSIAV